MRIPFIGGKQLTVTNQYVLPVYSLTSSLEIKNIIGEIQSEENRRKGQETILDLGMLDDVGKSGLDIILSELRGWNLIVGTDNDDIKKWVAENPSHKRTPCFQLLYTPLIRSIGKDNLEELTTHEQIETHINAGLARLEEKVNANRVSKEGLPAVQPDSEGHGDDLQTNS